ncbi:MAG: flavin reductase family protein [Nitrospirae bacterium]|nr:flavin reductase family protein [Nitrospirota bacterium]
MKTEKDISKTGFYHFYPVVPAIIVVKAGDSIDALACAWYSAVSFEPPLFAVSIAPKRYSYQMLKKSGEFTVNFLEFDNAGTIAALGRTSGRELDKFSAYRIKTLPSSEIKTPILKDAYAAYECRIVKRHRLGDHDLFIGEVLAVHYKEKAFDKKNKQPNLSKLTPALYLGADYYAGIKSFSEVRIGKEDVMGGGRKPIQ